MKTLQQLIEQHTCALASQAELRALEAFGDRLLDKFDIDIEFTRHFGERLGDDRNKPCITLEELKQLFHKIEMKQGKPIKNYRDMEVVLKDIQRDLNIPVVIDYKRPPGSNRAEFEVRLKTIMRKKNFMSPDPQIKF